jgi:transcriptional regulator of acetoin/glycerol metabolism
MAINFGTASGQVNGSDLGDLMEKLEQRVILGVIKSQGGNVTAASQVLGVSRMFVYRRLRKYGVEIKR